MNDVTQPSPPDPADAASPVELVEALRRLRLWAGEPSLRRLRQLAGTTVDISGRTIDALPISTVSYVLRRDSLPRMEFVRAYVAACLKARNHQPATAYLERWYEAWRRLRQPADGGGVTSAAVARPPVPRQLPADVLGFTGRDQELALLRKVAAGARGTGPVVITAIDGMAGIGKTALAVHAAHELAEQYPDGQLFIDLHGYTAGVSPVDPAAALDRMLRALGVPGERVPDDLDERAALWRSTAAGRRLLVVLDNAGAEDQVAALVPGTPGCLVLVTSRRRLAGLDAVQPVPLDTLPAPDAVALFVQAVGPDRLVGEPLSLVAELVELCGRLPLAIRIAAARLRFRPAWGAAELAERLRDHDQRLRELAIGQRSVTAALELSYQQLAVDERRGYRLLGLHPGPTVDAYAAAALAGVPLARIRHVLDRLLDAHLLLEPAPGRYAFHDLVKAHAADTTGALEPEPERRTAMTRLLDYYRQAASEAMDTAYPYERERRPEVPPAGTPVPGPLEPAQAACWLDTELPNLLAAAHHAAEHGWPQYTIDISATLHRHLRTRGLYRDAIALHTQALAAARAAGHLPGELDALVGLGYFHWRQGQHRPALDHFGRALEIAGVTGDAAGELNALIGLGHVELRLARYKQAIDCLERAMHIARATTNRAGELNARTGLGHINRMLGRHREAEDHFRRALEIASAAGNRPGELDALSGLGHVLRRQGRYEHAIQHFQRALSLARDAGHRVSEMSALGGLGDAHRRQGRYQQSADCYQELLDRAHEADHRNWQFEASQGLGRLSSATGHPELGRSHHRRALDLAGVLGQRSDQARAHDGLAHAYRLLNRPEPARRHWQRALDLLTEIGADYTEEDDVSSAALRGHLAERTG